MKDANGQWKVVPNVEYLRDIEHRLTRLEIMLYITIATSAMSFIGVHVLDSIYLLKGILP
jgi:cell division protein FtsL